MHVSRDINVFTLKNEITLKNETMTFLVCSITGHELFQQDYLQGKFLCIHGHSGDS